MKTTLGASLSIIHGVPLDEEPGLGALTLAGYLREVTDRYADREALVMRHPDGSVQRWSYRELWERSKAVACSLIACGIVKDSRVGVLMTNRPEWLASFFGIGMAGGLPVALSTFSTRAELEYFDGVLLEELAIREFLKVHLASYKVPRRVLFMREEELVLTGSAKVQLGALRELAMKRLGGTDA